MSKAKPGHGPVTERFLEKTAELIEHAADNPVAQHDVGAVVLWLITPVLVAEVRRQRVIIEDHTRTIRDALSRKYCGKCGDGLMAFEIPANQTGEPRKVSDIAIDDRMKELEAEVRRLTTENKALKKTGPIGTTPALLGWRGEWSGDVRLDTPGGVRFALRLSRGHGDKETVRLEMERLVRIVIDQAFDHHNKEGDDNE